MSYAFKDILIVYNTMFKPQVAISSSAWTMEKTDRLEVMRKIVL